MGAVDLDEVEAGALRAFGGVGVVDDDLLDLGHAQLVRDGRARVQRHGRGRDGRAGDDLAARVHELHADVRL